jgi:hypothetical protein
MTVLPFVAMLGPIVLQTKIRDAYRGKSANL